MNAQPPATKWCSICAQLRGQAASPKNDYVSTGDGTPHHIHLARRCQYGARVACSYTHNLVAVAVELLRFGPKRVLKQVLLKRRD